MKIKTHGGFQKIGAITPLVVQSVKDSESPIEAQMFFALANQAHVVIVQDEKPQGAGIFLKAQAPIGPYRADIYILARGYIGTPKVWPPKEELRLVVECDGKDWHTLPDQKEYDKKRDIYMKEKGIEVLRYTGKEIVHNPNFCAQTVLHFIQERICL